MLKKNIIILKNKFNFLIFKLTSKNKKKFICPLCNYNEPFMDVNPPTGFRKHAKCPRCTAAERHRIQFIVLNHILKDMNTKDLKILHFAPEFFFQDFLKKVLVNMKLLT